MTFPSMLGGPLWPAATLVAATFFVTGALTSASVPPPSPAPARPASIDIAQSEVDACERGRSRSHLECVGEAEGKALIRHAEWVAELDESGVDGLMDTSAQATGVIVLRPRHGIPD